LLRIDNWFLVYPETPGLPVNFASITKKRLPAVYRFGSFEAFAVELDGSCLLGCRGEVAAFAADVASAAVAEAEPTSAVVVVV
jgi:hypothetical protein